MSDKNEKTTTIRVKESTRNRLMVLVMKERKTTDQMIIKMMDHYEGKLDLVRDLEKEEEEKSFSMQDNELKDVFEE